jgi:hypothetical protein
MTFECGLRVKKEFGKWRIGEGYFRLKECYKQRQEE